MKQEQITLGRISSSNYRSTNKIIPASYFSRSTSSASFSSSSPSEITAKPLIRRDYQNYNNTNNSALSITSVGKTRLTLTTFLRSLLQVFSFPSSFSAAVPTCRWLTIPNKVLSLSSTTPSLGRKVTGTLFGHRKGHVSFAVQDDPRSDPALIIELAISTSALVREMSSGLVRIALECDRGGASPHAAARGKHAPKLFQEPMWTMYCNGRKCGYATSRACTEFDRYVLNTIQSVSVGAGVIPLLEGGKSGSGSEGELLHMRAKFERVVGSRDSEAFYMLNPDGNGGPELSIFLLRL